MERLNKIKNIRKTKSFCGLFLLFAGKGIIVTLPIKRTLTLPGDHIPVYLVLVHIHHAVVLVIFLVVIIMPTGLAQIIHRDTPQLQRDEFVHLCADTRDGGDGLFCCIFLHRPILPRIPDRWTPYPKGIGINTPVFQ